MGKNNVWVAKHPTHNWQVKIEGNQRARSLHQTQAQAIEAARKIAISNGSELKIQGKTGLIVNTNTYGRQDPCPPKDTKH